MKKRPFTKGPLIEYACDSNRRRVLAGVVSGNQLGNARVDVTDLYAAIHPGHSQVGVTLDFLPIGLKFVLVSKFVEKRV